MKICFVNFAIDWGGGEGWTLRTAEGLASRGHTVTIIARDGSPLAVKVSASKLSSFSLPVSYDYRPATVLALRRYLCATGAEVVVVHHNKDVRTAGVAAKTLSLPVVHRNGFPVVKDTWRHRITMRFTDRLLTNSTRIRETYRQWNWLRDKPVDVVPNGIDPADIPARDPELRAGLGFSGDALIALYAGRLTLVKRVDLLLRAFAELPEASVWRLAVAGAGGERDRLESLARELNPGGRVRFFGHREDARALASCADLAMLVSREEGMPNALLEAMAAGTAVAATPAGDVEYLLDNGSAGWILPMDDRSAWTQLLLRLEDAPGERAAMGAAGRERVAAEFTLERMLDGVEASLRAAAGR